MNFISPDPVAALAGSEPILTLELAHLWRSKIIDKCAEAERYLLRLLQAGGDDCSPKALFSQKMESLARAIAEPGCAIRAKKVGPLLKRLAPLSDLRSELAHSTLSVAEIEGEIVAVLRHATADRTRTLLSLTRLRACHAELSQIANSLSQEADRS